jgi:hypothetical protein
MNEKRLIRIPLVLHPAGMETQPKSAENGVMTAFLPFPAVRGPDPTGRRIQRLCENVLMDIIATFSCLGVIVKQFIEGENRYRSTLCSIGGNC